MSQKLFLYWLLISSQSFVVVTSLPATLFGDGAPFSVVWNGASEKCEQHFGIRFNFTAYNIQDNRGDAFYGDKMVIFYRNDLGLYPRVLSDGTKLNGGIPQLAHLEEHLNATSGDIQNVISNDTFSGLAVIDWENWRPLFIHNFDSKKVYKTLSEDLVRQQHPNWSEHRIKKKARHDFNKAARRFMLSTLQRATKLRPDGRWGFYGFPRCYKRHCAQVRHDNNRLHWMFSSSTGLYPSLYLKRPSDSWMKKARFVHKTLQETFRVFWRFSSANKTVVLPYTRFRYEDPEQFYDESELLTTMAMSALEGSAGVILWDNSMNFEQKDLCRDMERYLKSTLGPFVLTLTDFLQNCSLVRCNNKGRCVMKRVTLEQNVTSPFFLQSTGHLRHLFQEIIHKGFFWINPLNNATSTEFNLTEYLNNYEYWCQCYPGWSEENCTVSAEP